MERLADFHQDEVRDIDDIVYRPQADGKKLFLKPLGRWSDLDILDSGAGIPRSPVRSLDIHGYGSVDFIR